MDHAAVDSAFQGSASFEILLNAKTGQSFASEKMIKRLGAFSIALSLSANVASVVSFLDVGLSVLKVSKIDLSGLKIKEILENAAVKEKLDAAVLRPWLTRDFKSARVHVQLRTNRPDLHVSTEKALLSLKKSFADWFEVRPTGFAYLYKSMEKLVLTTFIRSFVFSLAGVLTAMFIVARGLRLGVAAALANLLPIAFVLGLLGYLDKGLSAGLVILPAVGLGLVVDDTIHFITAFRRATGDTPARVTRALESCGWPIVMTQIILIATFGSLALSNFATNIALSGYMVLLLIVGLVFDLFFVPAWILSVKCDR
jgi:hypothetical protein